MRELKCDECGEVLIKLSKGSEIKPNVIVVHESCPVVAHDSEVYSSNGAEDFASRMKSKDTFNDLFGGKIF